MPPAPVISSAEGLRFLARFAGFFVAIVSLPSRLVLDSARRQLSVERCLQHPLLGRRQVGNLPLPPHLAKAARALHDITGLGRTGQEVLEGSVLIVVEVAPDARGEGWSLDGDMTETRTTVPVSY